MASHKRSINGILLLDKPYGFSSNQALQQARGIFKAEKSGHAGTLDPLATGLLPILFGEASKFGQAGLNANKSYEAVVCLGIATDTADAMGKVIKRDDVPFISNQLLNQIQFKFHGELQQTPPMYSALKQNGIPLYKMARRNQIVERPRRAITIHALTLEQLTPQTIKMQVSCSKGTYVRTLAEDIAQSLGCSGHITALRRIQVGNLKGKMYTLDDLFHLAQNCSDQVHDTLLPLDALLTDLPIIYLNNQERENLFKGRKILYSETIAKDYTLQNSVRLYTTEGLFFGVGEIDAANFIKSTRLVSEKYLASMLG